MLWESNLALALLVCREELASGSLNKAPIWFSLMRTGSNSSQVTDRSLLSIWVNAEGQVRAVGIRCPSMATAMP